MCGLLCDKLSQTSMVILINNKMHKSILILLFCFSYNFNRGKVNGNT